MNNQNCCVSTIVDQPNCSGLACEIFEVLAERQPCTGGQFMVGVDLEYQTGSGLGFQLLGNGNNYGTFNYSELPVIIGPFDGSGPAPYEIVAIDLQHSTCSNLTTMDAYNCLEECIIQNVVAIPGDCNDNEDVFVTIEFESDNTGGAYTIIGNGSVFGPFAYSDGSITIGPFAANGLSTYDILISDNSANGCSESASFGPFDCQSTTSDEEVFANTTQIYTNQMTDLLYVKLAESTATSQLIIYNTIGQIQYRQSYPLGQKDIEVNLSDLSSGIYICEVIMDGKRATKKFSRLK